MFKKHGNNTANEIACIHNGRDGIVESSYAFKVFYKKVDSEHELQYLYTDNPHITPMLYPLFFQMANIVSILNKHF